MQNLRTSIYKKPSSHFGAFSNKCTKSKKLPPKSHTGGYLFSFNGQESDDEVSGVGNTMTAEFWEYDARLGRRFNIDPKPNTSTSVYACFNNNPICLGDKKGDTIYISFFGNKPEDASFREGAFNYIKGHEQVNDGVFVVLCHGNPRGIQIYNTPTYTPGELKKVLDAIPEWKDAMDKKAKITLVLYGCYTGARDYVEETQSDGSKGLFHDNQTIAQQLADKYDNLTVKAPNGFGIYGPNNSKDRSCVFLGFSNPQGNAHLNTFTKMDHKNDKIPNGHYIVPYSGFILTPNGNLKPPPTTPCGPN